MADGLPRQVKAAEVQKAEADRQLATLATQLGRARQVIDQFDRRLHRRGHEAEIEQAHRDVESIPHRVEGARVRLADAGVEIGRLNDRWIEVSATLRQRPEIARGRRSRRLAGATMSPWTQIRAGRCLVSRRQDR